MSDNGKNVDNASGGEDLSKLSIDALVNRYRSRVSQNTATESTGTKVRESLAKEERNLEQELRDRLYSGKRAQDRLTEYQSQM